MAETVTILIGNSDNKLSQAEWAEFYGHVDDAVDWGSSDVQFSGASNGAAPWQNACWVAVVKDTTFLRRRLAVLAKNYRQDSIALVAGSTEFIRPSSEEGRSDA